MLIFNILSQDTINDYYEEITSGSELNSNVGKTKFISYLSDGNTLNRSSVFVNTEATLFVVRC